MDSDLKKKDEEKTITEIFKEDPELSKLLELEPDEPKEKSTTAEERKKERAEAAKKKFNKLFEQRQLIEQKSAEESKELGFTVRSMVQTTLPHSRIMIETGESKVEDKKSSYTRINGNAKLLVIPNPEYGLPFGSLPRLIITWLVSETLRTKKRKILLADNLNSFLKELNLNRTGGKRGDIGRLREQLNRLFTCSIQYCNSTKINDKGKKFDISTEYYLWWDEPSNEEIITGKKESYVILSENFFDDIMNHPIPIDLRIVKALQDSSLALDIYCWITYKNSYTKNRIDIPWESLQVQFGAGYPMTSQGKQNFKQNFMRVLKEIAVLYPAAGKLRAEKDCLIFVPSLTSVAQKPKKPV